MEITRQISFDMEVRIPRVRFVIQILCQSTLVESDQLRRPVNYLWIWNIKYVSS
jgi:hypothetical protein